MKYILALDQGTTSSRALLFNERAQVVWLEQEEFAQHYPASGWVEHDALEIWETTRRCVDRALRRSGVRAEEIAAVGLTNQRETTILWDRKTGEPLAPAIVWQDRRTADFCEELRRRGEEESKLFHEKTLQSAVYRKMCGSIFPHHRGGRSCCQDD
mgnify:CR=1 FL=1